MVGRNLKDMASELKRPEVQAVPMRLSRPVLGLPWLLAQLCAAGAGLQLQLQLFPGSLQLQAAQGRQRLERLQQQQPLQQQAPLQARPGGGACSWASAPSMPAC